MIITDDHDEYTICKLTRLMEQLDRKLQLDDWPV